MRDIDQLLYELRAAIRAEVLAELLATLGGDRPATPKQPRTPVPKPNRPAKAGRAVACSKCRQPGHNAKTCKATTSEPDDEELDRRALVKLRAEGHRSAA